MVADSANQRSFTFEFLRLLFPDSATANPQGTANLKPTVVGGSCCSEIQFLPDLTYAFSLRMQLRFYEFPFHLNTIVSDDQTMSARMY